MKAEARTILIGAVGIILFGLLSSVVISNRTETFTLGEKTEEGSFACTMDAKVCPDGSFVGRVAPYCQFAACPQAY